MNNKITNSTIFITGGAGFIGSYVIEELLLNYQPKKIIILDNLIIIQLSILEKGIFEIAIY